MGGYIHVRLAADGTVEVIGMDRPGVREWCERHDLEIGVFVRRPGAEEAEYSHSFVPGKKEGAK